MRIPGQRCPACHEDTHEFTAHWSKRSLLPKARQIHDVKVATGTVKSGLSCHMYLPFATSCKSLCHAKLPQFRKEPPMHSFSSDRVNSAVPHSLRAQYHVTAPQQWLNDPQRPFYHGHECNMYYLYSSSYYLPGEWRHLVSHDHVMFEDQGIAIHLHEGLGVWSGSCVVDKDGTAGFGKNAILVFATQPSHGDDYQQEQYLWHSSDNGNTFSRCEKPVISNTDHSNWFRDPKIAWDEDERRWIAAIGRDHSVALYRSANLRVWQYLSTFTYQGEDIGGVECPDLFSMVADDGTTHWIIAGSMRGVLAGKTNTYAYWIGRFIDHEFVPDHEAPKWLDEGWDWYAAVTWHNPNDGRRYAIGWMNNWDYAARTVPTDATDNFNGMLSIVRTIRLASNGDEYELLSQPVETLDSYFSQNLIIEDMAVQGDRQLAFSGTAYRLTATIDRSSAEKASIRVGGSVDGSRYCEFGLDSAGFYMDRSHCERWDFPFKPWTLSRSEIADEAGPIEIIAFVDRQSVEVFVAEGRHVHSDQIYFIEGDEHVSLHAEGGEALFTDIRIASWSGVA
ncbi:glycoside hydrolase family 32 protein [Bifidobacterium aquikefiri]|uniref:glycoside hydrolase family 32 protein n=2 Tax=Bifidobacterium aquikefiri TaxID=1653207 RepID=UPI0030B84A69